MSCRVPRVARSCVVVAAVIAAAGCAERHRAPVSQTEAQAAQLPSSTFTFAPVSGTKFIRTERRVFENSLAGTPVVRREEQVLRWYVDIELAEDGKYNVAQELQRVTLKWNDKVMVDADVPRAAIAANLIIDRSGNLTDVRNLESTSDTLTSLAGPNLDPIEARLLSPDGLKRLITMRYEVLTGDLIGQPATVGATWSAPLRGNAPISSRKVTVERIESCGSTRCARLREEIKVDSVALVNSANSIVQDYVRSHGAPEEGMAADFKVVNATYSMTGSMLTEIDTMVNHGASLQEGGRVKIKGPKRTYDVDLKGTTDYTYDFGPPTLASR